MRKLLLLTVFSLAAFATALHAQDQSETKRYLYLSTPDAAQVEGQAEGAGLLIFAIDDGHKLVRRGLDYGRQGFDRWGLTREVLKAIRTVSDDE